MKEQIALEPIRRETCVVRATHTKTCRTISVEPGETASRNLFYGRIIIKAGDESVKFETGDRETGLLCLNGSATVIA